MGIDEFQQDLKDGMKLEDALIKHNLTLKEAVEFSPHPITVETRKYGKRKKYKKGYVDKYIQKRNGYYYVRRRIAGKNRWGGSYNSKREAVLVRDYLNENGWDMFNVKKACEMYNIERRRR